MTEEAWRQVFLQMLEGIKEDMDRDRKERREDLHLAADHREKLRSEMVTVRSQVDQLTTHTGHLTKRVEDLEPVATMVSSWRLRVIGALGLLGLLGGLISGVFVLFKAEVFLFLHRIFNGG